MHVGKLGPPRQDSERTLVDDWLGYLYEDKPAYDVSARVPVPNSVLPFPELGQHSYELSPALEEAWRKATGHDTSPPSSTSEFTHRTRSQRAS